MSNLDTLEEIEDLVRETIDSLARRINQLPLALPRVRWDRAKTRLGCSKFSRNLVSFSAVLWPHASFEERRDTVIHEACHHVNSALCRRMGVRAQPHGVGWQRLMRLAGIENPQRCHSLDLEGLGMVKRVEATCAKGHSFKLSTRMANAIRKYERAVAADPVTRYRHGKRICSKCWSAIKLTT